MIKKYDLTGKEIGEVKETAFFEVSEKESPALLAQAIRVYQDRKYQGSAHTQTRAEVNRTTKKLYRQKGTGGARHGSRRAPIFVGGGVAHGPRGVKRVLSLPTKMAKKALGLVLKNKLADKRLVVVGGMEKIKKTKEASQLITSLLAKTENKKGLAVVSLTKDNWEKSRFFSNLKNVKCVLQGNLNILDAFNASVIIFDIKDKKDKK